MIDYRCPACRKLAFRAVRLAFDRLELKCRGCEQVVTPLPVGPIYAEYACPKCRVLSVRVAAPDGLGLLCPPCGVRMRRVAPVPEEVDTTAPAAAYVRR